jgi:hypothetical protein
VSVSPNHGSINTSESQSVTMDTGTATCDDAVHSVRLHIRRCKSGNHGEGVQEDQGRPVRGPFGGDRQYLEQLPRVQGHDPKNIPTRVQNGRLHSPVLSSSWIVEQIDVPHPMIDVERARYLAACEFRGPTRRVYLIHTTGRRHSRLMVSFGAATQTTRRHSV